MVVLRRCVTVNELRAIVNKARVGYRLVGGGFSMRFTVNALSSSAAIKFVNPHAVV